MKAITAEPPKRNSINLEEIPEPTPGKGEVLLKTLSVGIDSTDREIIEGIYGTPPRGYSYLVLGHEALAKIEETGEEVEGVSEGDLVVPTVRRPCQENCITCRNGEPDMCITGNYFEHGIYRLHGFASEYALSDAEFLVKIPAELENTAVLLEPLSIAEKAISQAYKIQERTVWKPEKAFIAGAGSLGLLLTLILRLRGLEVYTAATRKEESLKAEIVRSTRGRYFNVRETPISTLREKFDIVIEATGKVESALEAIKLMGPNSVMCLLGIYREEKAFEESGNILKTIVLDNQLIFGSVSSNKNHFETGIKDMIEIKKRYGDVLNKMITRKLDLTDFRRAFEPEKEDIKTVICFE